MEKSNCFQKEEKLKLLKIREEYLKNGIEILKREFARAKDEQNRVKSVPLLMGQFLEIVDRTQP